MASSFRELQTLYEAYPLSNDTLAGNKYYPNTEYKHSFLGMPGKSTSGDGMPTRFAPTDDEEEHHNTSPCSELKNTLKQQISEYIAEAEEEKMRFALSRFFSLLETLDRFK